MDLLEYFPDYKFLVCRLCKYAASPISLQSRLQRRHKEDHHDLRGQGGPVNVAKRLLSRIDMDLLNPKLEPTALPASDSNHI